ncbi:hypothetical protein D3C85_1320210 [compost metagenome]
MTSITAVRINDNFTTSQTSIPLRSTDYESACWVNEVVSLFIQQMRWNDWKNNVLFNIFLDLLQCCVLIVLRGYNNRIYTNRFVIDVLNRYLRFTVWT